MSRIGRQPITIPAGITVEIASDKLKVTGPKGFLELALLPGLKLTQSDTNLVLERTNDTPESASQFGLMRTLVNNMIVGVSQGFTRQLEINGVGYRANVAGTTISLSLGFSHPIAYQLPDGITAKVEKNVITIGGHDKQLVGQIAANLRALKKPEPYKGKGIKYVEERIRRKAGKTATKG